jgi:DNA polymerase elongation subunit (family B)
MANPPEALTSSDFEVKTRKVKILIFDIETMSLVTRGWTMWDNPMKLVHDWYMISWSAKWQGGKHITKCLADYEGYEPGSRDDKALVTDLAKILSEADIIIGHNSDTFDLKKTTARLIIHRLPPMPPAKTVDTFKVAKKVGKFTQNSLKGLCRALGIGEKMETGGSDLWDQCEAGDLKAWRKMKAYNKQDCVLTEALYERFKPYITNHPNMSVLMGTEDGCRNCGGTHLQRHGWGGSPTGKYRRILCLDCNTWMRGSHEKVTNVR